MAGRGCTLPRHLAMVAILYLTTSPFLIIFFAFFLKNHLTMTITGYMMQSTRNHSYYETSSGNRGN